MKKAKRKRPVVARKRKVTARKKPATPRKRRKAKMTSKKSSDDDEDGPPRTTPSHPTGTRQAGTTPEQRSAGHPTQTSDPVELAKNEQGDPMGQPPDSPLNPNMPPDDPNDPDPQQRNRPDDRGPLTKPAEGQRRDK